MKITFSIRQFIRQFTYSISLESSKFIGLVGSKGNMQQWVHIKKIMVYLMIVICLFAKQND